MEPVTVVGTTDIVITAPANATIVITESGTLTDKTFSIGFNGGGETHVITAADTVTSITLNLGAGTNLVTVNALDPAFTGSLAIKGGAGDDTVVLVAKTGPGAYTFDGGAGDDTLTGPDVDTGWQVTGPDEGALDIAAFSGVENLVGGNATDAFALAEGGALSGSIDGGGGSDALVATDTPNEWVVSGANAGTLTLDVGGSAVDIVFASIENLTGRSFDDKFLIGVSGSIDGVIDGGPSDADADTQPVDTLDFSARISPVLVYLSGGATAIEYVFSTATADADPGPGMLRLGSLVQSAATVIRADAENPAGVAVAALLDAFDDAPGAAKGRIRIADPDDDTKWLEFDVIAVATPGGGRLPQHHGLARRVERRVAVPRRRRRRARLHSGRLLGDGRRVVRQHRLTGRRL